jgi:hypothetical protein
VINREMELKKKEEELKRKEEEIMAGLRNSGKCSVD